MVPSRREGVTVWVLFRNHPAHTDGFLFCQFHINTAEEIDNLRGTGAVSVGGKIWTARMAEADGKAARGETTTSSPPFSDTPHMQLTPPKWSRRAF